jgi:exopolysaccharide production protein ExoZ
MTNVGKRQKFTLLQGFRGIASLLVLAVHGTQLIFNQVGVEFLGGIFQFGYAGVDFFFVLSGFIIYHIHCQDIGQSERTGKFLLKRFLRVYPLYWLVMITRTVAGHLAETSLLMFASALVLFPYPTPPLLNVSWTLTYEIFFYLLFSLLIWQPAKFVRGGIALWIGTIVVYWLLHPFGWYRHWIDHPAIGFLLSPYHLEFVLGCLAAYLVQHYTFKRGHLLMALGIGLYGIAAIIDVWLHKAPGPINPIWFDTGDLSRPNFTGRYSLLFFGVPSFIIVLGAIAWEMTAKIKVPNWFTYLGDASYSIYLIHGLIIFNGGRLLGHFNADAILVNFGGQISLLAIALGGGCLCHEWLEKPLARFCQQRLRLQKA